MRIRDSVAIRLRCASLLRLVGVECIEYFSDRHSSLLAGQEVEVRERELHVLRISHLVTRGLPEFSLEFLLHAHHNPFIYQVRHMRRHSSSLESVNYVVDLIDVQQRLRVSIESSGIVLPLIGVGEFAKLRVIVGARRVDDVVVEMTSLQLFGASLV